jgi:hypothetical protein
MRHLPTATIAAATTLLLTACAAATPRPSHPPAAQCAEARSAARQLGLIPSHFRAVTSPHSLTAAYKQLGLPTPTSSTSSTFESYLIPNVKSPTLNRELQRIEDDYKTFWAAWATSNHSAANARAVGTAARTIIRDIHAITTTCPEH